MRCSFSDRFEFTGYIRGSDYTYHTHTKHFLGYEIKVPDARAAHIKSHDMDDSYQLQISGPVNFFKAAVITLNHFVYTNDHDFYIWSEQALRALKAVPQSERKSLNQIEQDLKVIQLKKNRELAEIHLQLKAIGQQLELEYKFLDHPFSISSNLETIADQNKLLIEENNKLFRQVTEAARKKANQYNESALKAIILSLSMHYLSTQNPPLMAEAIAAVHSVPEEKEALPDSLEDFAEEKAIILTQVTLQLPEPGKIYPFLAPNKEFPHLIENDTHCWQHDIKSLDSTNSISIQKSEVADLQQKVNRLFANHQICDKDQQGWFSFLTTLKQLFSYLYKKIINFLKDVRNNTVEQHSDLAENVENITNGSQITETAQLIHKFNSAPSPLVAIIYDQELEAKVKEDLLAKLARAKPYRFQHETAELRLNIDIPAQSPNFSPKGSPLHHATKHGSLKMMEILLANGAAVNTQGQCIGISNIDYSNVTSLHMAVAQGDIEKVKLLLRYGADPNAVNELGQTSLHAVTDVAIYNLLITNKANINHQDKNGQTPLHFAAKQGKQLITEALLKEAKLSIDLADNLGNTALHLAAATSFEMKENQYPHYSFATVDCKAKKTENLAIMSGIIKRGATVNQKNKRGYTALHMAVLDESSTISYDSVQHHKRLLDYQHIQQQVVLLCENGANVNSVSDRREEKETYSSYQEYNLHPAPGTNPLLALYTKTSSESDNHPVLASQRLAVAQYLVKRDANYKLIYPQNTCVFGSYQNSGNSILHQCARFADGDAFAYFHSLGLDANYQASPQHNTPFHEFMYWKTSDYSWNHGGAKTMQLLFDHGVDVHRTKEVRIKIEAIYGINNTTIMSIFRHDNIISQTAKTMGFKIDEIEEKNCREILKTVVDKIWKERRETPEVSIPLTALEYSQGAYQYRPVPEVIEMIKKQSKQSLTAAAKISMS